jgi:hypothetical protein
MRCARIHYVGHLVAGIVVLLGVRVLAPRVPSIRALCWIRTATEWVQVDTRGRNARKHTCWNSFPQSAEPEESPVNTTSVESNIDKRPTLIAASLSLAMV